jgi:pimeloyl-ACP methyl ester carboxylesterase
MVIREFDVELPDGRTLHGYDTGEGARDDRLTVVWHHGTPNIGTPPEPLFPAADRLEIRWMGYDRPSYGGSSPRPGRDVGSAAGDAAAIADAAGVDRFAVMGHSGGAMHALACAAMLPGRVSAVVGVSALAPFRWFAGMAPGGVATLQAAAAGREAKERYEASAPEGDPGFNDADWAALAGEWSWFNSVVGPAMRAGPAGMIDDDLAYVAPWGFDPSDVGVPVLLVHGGQDRIAPVAHGKWLASHIANAELRVQPDDGHISVLGSAPAALEWLAARAAG